MVVLVNRPSSKATSFPLSYGTNLFWVEKLNIFGGKRRFPCELGGCCPDPAERHTTHPHVPKLNPRTFPLGFSTMGIVKRLGEKHQHREKLQRKASEEGQRWGRAHP